MWRYHGKKCCLEYVVMKVNQIPVLVQTLSIFSSTMPAALWTWLHLPSNPCGDMYGRKLRASKTFFLCLPACGCACLLPEWRGWGRVRKVLDGLDTLSRFFRSWTHGESAWQADSPPRKQHTLWQRRKFHLNTKPTRRPSRHEVHEGGFSNTWLSFPAQCPTKREQAKSSWREIQE